MRCMEITGLLIPRPCRSLAVAECCLCHKAICEAHTVAVPDVGATCAQCAAERGAGPEAERRRLREAYGVDDAHFYGAHGTGIAYTEADYAAFEQPAEDGEPAERLDES